MQDLTPFEFISTHIHMVGWSTITAFVGRLIWLTWKGGHLFAEGKERVLAAEANVNKMATNCVPTIQDNIVELNQKADKTTGVLESIDKNIAILVDRGRRNE